jgi:polysaccharide export outer membrane protein
LIGSVQVKGLTVKDVELSVKSLYEKDYLVYPSIRVIVVAYAKKWVTVSGAVLSPGRVPYPEEGTINLPSAIAMTGGVMEMGNSGKITVARKKGGSKIYSLAASSKIILYPGDTVLVPRLPIDSLKRLPTCTVSGEVRNPGNIEMVDGKLDILTAIAMAGGYSRIANQKEAILQKKVKGGHRPSKVSLRNVTTGKAPMVFIYPGDILIIQESRF